MRRDEVIAGVLLGCLGSAIAMVAFLDVERSSLHAKVLGGGIIFGAVLVLALLLYISYVKHFRSRVHSNAVENGEGRMARWSALGASFSGLIMLAFTALTGFPSSFLIAGLGGMLSGFMISLSLAVILKYSLEKFKIRWPL